MNTTQYMENKTCRNHEVPDRTGRALGGIVIIAVGAVLLASKMGVVFPEWIFTWQMIVITAGIFFGARHSFRHFGWLIPVAVGTLFLIDRFDNSFSLGHIMWPIIVIAIGLNMIFRPRHRRK